ncbi:MAG: hypothetical protein KatS3mg082_0059 [Nitrospiraceae bacterium]|nr:MAG: hypothetical protein KatS3mg082_0059 [Nitrospiraceae bacterium]
MEDWRKILAESVVKPKDLAERLGVDEKEIEAVVGEYPMRITPTVMAMIKEPGDAIWKQVVPDIAEMADADAEDDPLEEDVMSPVPHLVHRYPDRVLLMVTNQCPIYCRFCTRKRLVGETGIPQERRTGPGDRLLAGTHRSPGRHPLRRRPAPPA